MTVLYTDVVFFIILLQSATNCCALPHNSLPRSQMGNDNNLTIDARSITPPNTVYLPTASGTGHDGNRTDK